MSELRELPIRITRQKLSFTGVGEKPYEGEPDFGEELFATLNSLKLEGASQDYGRTLFNATFTGDLEEGYRSVRQEVEQRSARALVRLVRQAGRKVPEGVEIDFPITRQELAEMSGSTLHTVSRTLSAWEHKGVLESTRRHIVVCKPHALVAMAEDLGGPAAE